MNRTALRALVAVAAGVVHAAVLVGVAVRLGYDVGPTLSTPLASTVRYGGVSLVGALAVWFALEDRLVVPVALLCVLAGAALYWELTPPGPTFQDVAELEPNIDGPTGYTVVTDGGYLTSYLSAWYAWLVGIVLAGGWEHVVRTGRRWLPAPRRAWTAPTDRSRVAALALGAGLLHAIASLVLASRWGMIGPPGVLVWGAIGGVLVLGLPVYLLLRADLALPTGVALGLFVNSVHAQQYASGPGDPHALYVGAWVVFLAIPLLAGALEYAAVRVGDRAFGVRAPEG